MSLYRKSEVIAYLEDKISLGIATDEECEMYEDYKWNKDRILNKHKNTYKRLLKEMILIHNGID